ncbi:ABC transporter ATP-binding protein [Nocardia cyriacigeorgica]|uniref:Aliphatic sulfonates import ATP-binding protein SsuB n=1 Tax=Nocardia cyriacigeorgica TaxID=135487 RepID=A0A4U8W3P1_9NOCA|nr:ABC transporter ATP-binding protein [Nocardia cyriacigeorgica]MBF6098282.1 ABC transporter ATP-binding protein [Nocardia cyriacigeorgica]MBF6157673.1 ABC transporter ATP-binding protein [Nocardia cyriacigeorgica]MBF6196645.1 ABC transporter ATP-binding protein [Nocardia cyriacigeorgica]MBF6318096.1 ABC transporter ATP-binding protein [Nocardia cyriacigeorgica]MBF6346473.1 ABC transporter ATP-binding protein [Nocardia cyriacigeorgica]
MSAATIEPAVLDTDVVASTRGLTKRFGSVTALEDVTLDLRANTIYGLLGRNGAGKTTLMQVMTGQAFQTAGEVRIFGHTPHENTEVLRGISFIKESQAYPADYKVKHVLAAARHLLRDWDEEFARELLRDFDLPTERKVKKLSRGMTSALGVIIGLASRAPLTFFDEPYLGLDAVSRQLFYDRLLADYAEHPRTIVLSTHLIDEVADLLEHVLLIDRGRLVVDAPADDLRDTAMTVSGLTTDVDSFLGGRPELRRESLGNQARVVLRTEDRADDIAHAKSLGLLVEPVSLQQLIVETTNLRGKDQ